MAEELAKIGDVEICFETFGSRDDPALLLVMGLGTQMIAWPEGFCRQLAGRGFFVIRYDNRDIGRSTHMRQYRPPTIRQLLLRDKSAAKYSLADMAADGMGLLDHLGIERAHVAGASMGGMIAQTMAVRYPDRVLSLASIMSNTGHRWKGTPGLRGISAPTVVIHGTRDRMVRPSGGRATAAAIPGARLVTIRGMGHDLPRGAWDRMVDAIVANAQRADASARRTAAA